jgi:hypothetical protein
MPKRIVSPGQLNLFELPVPEAPESAPKVRRCRRRRFYKGIQLPLPIQGAEPMAIGFKPDGPLLANGEESDG